MGVKLENKLENAELKLLVKSETKKKCAEKAEIGVNLHRDNNKTIT